MTSSPLNFGPQAGIAWVAILCGAVSLACAVLLCVAAAHLFVNTGSVIFCGIMALASGAFGGWILLNGLRIRKFRAIVSTDSPQLTAQRGPSLWSLGSLGNISIPWTDVQGVESLDADGSGLRENYILYTRSGDFILNQAQWRDLAGLLQEITRRSGKSLGHVDTERAAAQGQVQMSKRRMAAFQRIFGWVVLCISSVMMLIVLVAGLTRGFDGGLLKAGGFSALALSLGIAMAGLRRRKPAADSRLVK